MEVDASMRENSEIIRLASTADQRALPKSKQKLNCRKSNIPGHRDSVINHHGCHEHPVSGLFAYLLRRDVEGDCPEVDTPVRVYAGDDAEDAGAF